MASEYEGPGLRVPVEEIGSTGYTREEKQKTKAPPGGDPPLMENTRSRGGKGPRPRTRAGDACPPKRGGASTGEKKRKREITVSYSSQFASGSTKARKYATAVLSPQPLTQTT